MAWLESKGIFFIACIIRLNINFQGTAGYADHVEKSMALAEYFEKKIRENTKIFKAVLDQVV